MYRSVYHMRLDNQIDSGDTITEKVHNRAGWQFVLPWLFEILLCYFIQA